MTAAPSFGTERKSFGKGWSSWSVLRVAATTGCVAVFGPSHPSARIRCRQSSLRTAEYTRLHRVLRDTAQSESRGNTPWGEVNRGNSKLRVEATSFIAALCRRPRTGRNHWVALLVSNAQGYSRDRASGNGSSEPDSGAQSKDQLSIEARKQRSALWRTPSGERCRNDFFGNPRAASLARQLACGRDRSARRPVGLRTNRAEVLRASTHKRNQKRRNNTALLRGFHASSGLGPDVGRPAQHSSLSFLRGAAETAPSGTFAD